MADFGDTGGIFYKDIQVGAFGSPTGKHRWRFDEITSPVSSNPGENRFKITGWKATVNQYIFWLSKLRKAGIRPARICGTIFDFVFATEDWAYKCRGKITQNGIKIGDAVTERLTMAGKAPVKRELTRRRN